MIPYAAGELLCVAAPGTSEGETENSPVGSIRSRDGSKLRYSQNDIELTSKKMPTYGGYTEKPLEPIFLIDPTVEEVGNAFKSATHRLRNSHVKGGRKKILNIVYAGHGDASDGAWVLKDGTVSGADLFNWISGSYEECPDRLHIDLIIDSCFSSRFLIDLMVVSQSQSIIYPFDCYVSSLPDEKSWEMEFIEHGAMSFCLNNEGNAHVDQNELARAIDERDQKIIAKALQGVTVPNPVTFITNGRQHSVVLTSGHFLEVKGAGSVSLSEVTEPLTHSGLADALHRAKTAYGRDVGYCT